MICLPSRPRLDGARRGGANRPGDGLPPHHVVVWI